jgi:DivIVA domain-containing protein
VAEDELSRVDADESEPSRAAQEQEQRFADLRHHVPADILDVSFPVSVRGYDRQSVDAYLDRVNHVIAELKVSASPRAAVTRALEQTEQQVSGLLQRARETAEEITASAREEAEESRARAKAELAELVVNVSAEADATKAEAETIVAKARTDAEDILLRSRLEAENTLARARAEADETRQRSRDEIAAMRDEAETQLHALQADIAAVRKERGKLLDEIREKASGLADLAEAAAARRPGEPEEEMVEPEAGDGPEPRVATDEPTRANPAGSPRGRRRQDSRRHTGDAARPDA